MSLIYFVFLEIPLRWLDICPISIPPPQKEEAFGSSITSCAEGTQCPSEVSGAELWGHAGGEEGGECGCEVHPAGDPLDCVLGWS